MRKKDNVISFPSSGTGVTRLQSIGEKDFEGQKRDLIEKTARCLLRALDCKDHYTFGHSMRVAFYAQQLGRELGLTKDELYELELASLFHDIGKIGVPDAVLLKPSRLDDKEFQEMKLHPEKSAEILDGFVELDEAAKFARHHHERYDGRGYPDGLKGEDIPLYSRIILIADTFDAMTSTRPYRKGLPYDVAFGELKEFSGTQFDPTLAETFIKAMQKDQRKKEATFSLNIVQGKFNKEAA